MGSAEVKIKQTNKNTLYKTWRKTPPDPQKATQKNAKKYHEQMQKNTRPGFYPVKTFTKQYSASKNGTKMDGKFSF
jgi:hypothetical protein